MNDTSKPAPRMATIPEVAESDALTIDELEAAGVTIPEVAESDALTIDELEAEAVGDVAVELIGVTA